MLPSQEFTMDTTPDRWHSGGLSARTTGATVRVERCTHCRLRWDCSAGKTHSVAWRRVHCPQWASLPRAPIPLRAVRPSKSKKASCRIAAGLLLTSATLPCPRGSWVRHHLLIFFLLLLETSTLSLESSEQQPNNSNKRLAIEDAKCISGY